MTIYAEEALMYAGVNHRNFPRITYHCPIKLSAVGVNLEAKAENIGLGGISVILPKQLERYTNVSLELFIEENSPIRCVGRVVWCVKHAKYRKNQPDKFDTGIEFTNIELLDKEKLIKVVDDLLGEGNI